MNTRQISFALQGMRDACANCAVTLERALMRLDGVIAAHVNYATERAIVTFDPTRVTTERLVRVVQAQGFAVQTARATRTFASVLRRERIAGFAPHALVNARVDWLRRTLELEWFADQSNDALSRTFILRLIGRALWHPAVRVPIFASILASFGMMALYVLILTLFQNFAHALQQAAQDWLWIGLVALGFGAQMGLYVYLRLLVDAAQTVGASVATGTGTTTSTLGMIACCAHHLTDLAPLVAFAGASSLSGAISFLNEWKYVFIALGLMMNGIGILITLRTIRKSRAHLSAMMDWFAKPEPKTAAH